VTSDVGTDAAESGTATSVSVASSFALATTAVVVVGRQVAAIGRNTWLISVTGPRLGATEDATPVGVTDVLAFTGALVVGALVVTVPAGAEQPTIAAATSTATADRMA
jgi:hypothetical protein